MSRAEIWKRIKAEILDTYKYVAKIKDVHDIYELEGGISHVRDWVYTEFSATEKEYPEVDTAFIVNFEKQLNQKIVDLYKAEFEIFIKNLDNEICKDIIKNI